MKIAALRQMPAGLSRIKLVRGLFKYGALSGVAGLTAMGAALADPSGAVNLFSLHADNPVSIAAVVTTFAVEPGKAVRLTIYDSEENFLQTASAKLEALVNEDGVAVASLDSLTPGDYAIAAYLDENGDGKLNRGKLLGIPKEPVAFSNGVKIKLSKPRYEDAKVRVEPGSVVVITLDE